MVFFKGRCMILLRCTFESQYAIPNNSAVFFFVNWVCKAFLFSSFHIVFALVWNCVLPFVWYLMVNKNKVNIFSFVLNELAVNLVKQDQLYWRIYLTDKYSTFCICLDCFMCSILSLTIGIFIYIYKTEKPEGRKWWKNKTEHKTAIHLAWSLLTGEALLGNNKDPPDED